MNIKTVLKKNFGKLKDALSKLAREGMSQKKMAVCIALGICFGIFPVLGATTILCAIAAFVFRLNLALIQLVNYAVYPLQLILLTPFYVAGNWLFGSLNRVDAGRQLVELLQNDLGESLLQIWELTLYAVFVWLLVSPAIVLILYGLLKPAVGKIQSAVKRVQSVQDLSKNPT